MAHTLAIKGAAAELHWAWHHAASLGAWAVARTSDQWTFTATVLAVDDFAVSQRPLVVVTPNGWRWPVVTLQIADGTLTAVLSPQE